MSNITLTVLKVKHSPKAGTRQEHSLSPISFYIVSEALARVIRQRKGERGIQPGKEKNQSIPIFLDMTLYLKDFNETTRNF